MLKIKLARFGKRKQPRYRFVIKEANSKRDTNHVDVIGYYSPTLIPKELKLDLKAYDAWIVKGAQPTATVSSLAEIVRSGKPFPTKKPKLSRKAQAKKISGDKKPAEQAPKIDPAKEPETPIENVQN